MEGLSQLTNLRLLDLSNNRLEKVEGLETLTRCALRMCLFESVVVCGRRCLSWLSQWWWP